MKLRKTTWIPAIFTLVLVLSSCRGLVEETRPDQEEAGAYLAFQLGEGGRTVLPSVETTGLTNFVLEGTREGGQRQDLGAWSSYSQFLSATVAVQPGVWRFTLTAQAASSRLAASLAEVVVNVGQNTLHFPLGYTDYGTAGGSGAVEVSLDIPSGGGVVAATGGLYAVMTDSPVENFQDEELQLSGAAVHYQKDAVPVGQYFLKIKLYADAGKEVLVNTYEELVRVADGSRSVASREIESLNEVYSITYQWNGGGLASGATAPLKFTRHSSIALPTAFEVDKAGCCLLGWYDNAECSGVPITEIVPGTVQNKTLYAQWGRGVKVNSGTVASLDLTAVAGDYHIMVAGSIYSSIISTLKAKLTAAGTSAKIHLDLSQTTGLTSIGRNAFSGCSGLTSVEIPASVTSIDSGVFRGCIGLTSVTFGEGSQLESIGVEAFAGCIGLTNVEIPASVTSIDSGAFYGCSGLASVAFGESSQLESIRSNAFKGCIGLTSVEIPSGVTSIGFHAFEDCIGLTSVEIPASVTSIGDYAFSGCSGLTSVYYQGDLARWCEGFKGDYYNLMSYCRNLYINGKLVQGDLVIPAGVTSIGTQAFSGCSGLASVEIPSSVTSIGENAFSRCSGLTSVEIPSSVTSIGDYAFYGCSGLTSVEIPASVTSIGSGAFWGCSGLTSVTFGEGSQFEYIFSDAFAGCTGLTSVEIPASVTSIGSGAFSGCSGLASVAFGEGSQLESIGSWAFDGCSGLSSVEIPASVTSIGSCAFDGCSGLTSVYYQGDLARWCEGFEGGYNLMSYCRNLYINGELVQGDLVIPSGVTSIGGYAFYGCSGLTSVEIPASVTSIGRAAFYSCNGLTSVKIPASVTSIGELAFSGCRGLTSVTFGDTSGWYVTQSSTDAANKTGGTAVTLSSRDLAANARLVNGTYNKYYWYKVD